MKNTNLTLGGVLSLLTLSALVTGCSANFNGTMTGATPSDHAAAISGTLMGGEQPILGAHIYLFAAGTAGYGSASTNVLTTCATASTPACSGPATLHDGDGYYVTTDMSTGAFTLTGTYTCPTNSSQMYLLSEGGNSGGGINAAAYLMAALGSCGNLSASTYITMNELTTVAGVTSLQQFISGPTAIGSNGGTPLGLQNAFTVANLLVNINNGVPAQSDANVTYPTLKIYTLGDSMAECVNSSGTSSPACTDFLGGAIDESSPGTKPLNTFNAMFNIARYPAAAPATIFAGAAMGAIFGATNVLTTAPNDFSLPIVYTGQGLTAGQGQASSIAIDAFGDAIVGVCGTSCDPSTQQLDALVEINPYGGSYGTGYVISGAGYGVGSVHNIQSLALDQSNLVYTTNAPGTTSLMPHYTTPSLSIVTRSGVDNTGSPITSSDFMTPEGIAFDTTAESWITDPTAGANAAGTGVYNVSTGGYVSFPLATINSVNGDTAITSPKWTTPTGITIDSNANVIVTDDGVQSSGIPGGLAIFVPAGAHYSETYASVSNMGNSVGATNPTAVAVDNAHNIWELDPYVRTLYKLDSTGANITNALSVSGTAISGAASVQNFIIDGMNNLAVPVCATTCSGSGPDSLAFIATDGSVITGRSGLQDASLSNPTGIAIDASGNTWVTNAHSGTVTEFVGMSAPVITPLSQALSAGTLATRP